MGGMTTPPPGMIPMPVFDDFALPMPDISAFVALGMPYRQTGMFRSWLSSAGVMTAVTMWRFSREEFQLCRNHKEKTNEPI